MCPVLSKHVTATAVSDANKSRKNLIIQLTAPVKWTEISANDR
jgi:[acyl-carrier-protein] S-malonyltransferase